MKKVKKTDANKSMVLVKMLKGVLIAYLFTFIVFVIYAFLLTYTDLSEKYISIVILITTSFSVLLSGYITAKNAEKSGIFWGMASAGLYVLIMILIGICTKREYVFSLDKIILFSVAISLGAIGGILGINNKN